MQDVSMFDIVVIAITMLLGLKGFFRGFVKEFFGLVGIIGGIFVASRLAETVGGKIAPLFALENGASIQLMGFIVSLIVFWVVAYALGTIISKIFSLSGLGIFDRIFGFLFGSFKIFLIFSVIIYALSQIETIKEKLDNSVGNTISYPLLVAGGSYIVKLDEHIPAANIKENIDSAVDSAKEKIEKTSVDVLKDTVEQGLQEAKDKLDDASIDTVRDTLLQKQDKIQNNASEKLNNQENSTTTEESSPQPTSSESTPSASSNLQQIN